MKSLSAIHVTFLPSGICVTAASGDTVLDVALEHYVEIEHECGGNCSCTTCRVEVVDGAEYISAMEWPEKERLAELDDRTQATRLSCQALLTGGGDVIVSIPVSELVDAPP